MNKNKGAFFFIIAGLLMALPVVFFIKDFDAEYWPRQTSLVLADIAFILLFFQYILSARIKFLEKGLGLDYFYKVHKVFAIAAMNFITLHFLIIFLKDFLAYGLLVLEMIGLVKIIGIAAFCILLITVLSSVLFKKLPLPYEVWKNLHRLNFVVLPLVFIHSLVLRSDLFNLEFRPVMTILWFSLMAFYTLGILHKVVHFFLRRKNYYLVEKIRQESHDVWSVFFKGPALQHKPGQFLLLQLQRQGKTSTMHPFTISSAPGAKLLSCSIKESGDFSSTIKQTKTGDKAFIDAPYGIFSYQNYSNNKDNLMVLVAGGIGITPFMSMLRQMAFDQSNQKVLLVFGNKKQEDIVFKEELQEISQKIPLKVVHVLSAQDNFDGEKGFINGSLLQNYIDDPQDCEYFICGPPVMMNKLKKDLQVMGIKSKKIHNEEFSL